MKNFCNRPFNSMHIDLKGGLKCCCKVRLKGSDKTVDDWWENDKDLIDLRERLLRDEQPEVCSACWEEEKHGESLRVNKPIGSFDSKVNKPKDLFWDVHNKCNLQCKMCTPLNSTALIKIFDKVQIDNIEKRKGYDNIERIDSVLKVVEEFGMSGGEPFLDFKHLRNVLDILIENKNLKIFCVCTNGTLVDIESLQKMEVLSKRGVEIRIIVSIDGNRVTQDYIRNSDYDTIRTNLLLFKEYIPLVKISTSLVLQALSAGYYLSTIQDLLDITKFDWYGVLLFRDRNTGEGSYHGIDVLPKPIIEQYLKKTERDLELMKELIDSKGYDANFKKYITELLLKNVADIRARNIEALEKPFDEAKWKSFCSMMNMFDRKQGKNILDVYPEFATYWHHD